MGDFSKLFLISIMYSILQVVVGTSQPRQRYFFSFNDQVEYKWNTISRE